MGISVGCSNFRSNISITLLCRVISAQAPKAPAAAARHLQLKRLPPSRPPTCAWSPTLMVSAPGAGVTECHAPSL